MSYKDQPKKNLKHVTNHAKEMKKGGFIRIHPWIHADDRPRVMKYIERLRKKRTA